MEASQRMMEEKAPKPTEAQKESATFICSRDTLDGVYPPLLLAINARRQGMDASIFFTFMGLNAIRKGWIKKIKFQPPGFLGAIPGMSSMATGMMKKKIEKEVLLLTPLLSCVYCLLSFPPLTFTLFSPFIL